MVVHVRTLINDEEEWGRQAKHVKRGVLHDIPVLRFHVLWRGGEFSLAIFL